MCACTIFQNLAQKILTLKCTFSLRLRKKASEEKLYDDHVPKRVFLLTIKRAVTVQLAPRFQKSRQVLIPLLNTLQRIVSYSFFVVREVLCAGVNIHGRILFVICRKSCENPHQKSWDDNIYVNWCDAICKASIAKNIAAVETKTIPRLTNLPVAHLFADM